METFSFRLLVPAWLINDYTQSRLFVVIALLASFFGWIRSIEKIPTKTRTIVKRACETKRQTIGPVKTVLVVRAIIVNLSKIPLDKPYKNFYKVFIYYKQTWIVKQNIIEYIRMNESNTCSIFVPIIVNYNILIITWWKWNTKFTNY